MTNFRNILLFIVFMLVLVGNITFAQPKDWVNGNLIQFNDNGLWCWFQDERAVVDMTNGKLILGSAAYRGGVGGQPRDGADDAVFFDLHTGTSTRSVLNQWPGNPDDHNTAGFLIRPDGKYLAMYDQHYDNNVTRYRIFDGNTWAPEQTYNWTTKPGGIDYTIAYNNVYYLSAENKMYDFSRANHRAPNFLVSTNMGDSWTWGGQLTTNTSNSYNKGYYKYWSNGVDRIDFIFTEQHPRDTLTSIYHGYIKGGKAYRSDGTIVDDNIYDTTYIPAYWNFTKVFGDSTIIGTDTMRRCWQSDLMRYDDGTIAAVITARVNQSISYGYPDNNVNPDHAFIYCRYDGANWSHTYLGKAGMKLYSSEADYTGLAALCPNDPNTLYISTPYSPIDTSISLGVREIWKGVTANNGASWSWSPITQNSVRDNLRPIVPLWDNNNTALLWCRGTYSAAQIFDASVVGIIDRRLETISKKSYIDADTINTTLANGSPLTHTGPDANAGLADNLWHIRTGVGNGGTVLTSAELAVGENAPAIKTHVSVPSSGTYDVWVNFWGVPTTSADWRIKAGLSTNSMQVFRSMACKEVDSTDYDLSPVRAGTSNTFLYQAYLGRIQVSGANTFDVFVDDSAYQVGTTSPLKGDVNRTWYDGISYASVNGTSTAPIIALSGTTINFGTIAMGVAKKDSIRVSNTGNSDLHITSISSTNARFTFAPAALTLAPSRSAYVVVTFTPQDTSIQSGSIILSHDASGSPDTIAVSGKGISVPVIALSKTSISFGTETIGMTKKDSILVSNAGTANLQITAISSTNVRFTFAPSTMTLAPSGSAYLVVTFAPQDTTVKSGLIILLHNALGSPDTITVNGKGSMVPVPTFALSGTSISFGTVTINTTKKDSVHVSNLGTDTLRITTISSTNARFTLAPATMKLAPSGSAYLVVAFAPQDTSVQSGFIILTHNASGSPDTIAVSGKGSSPVSVDNIVSHNPAEFALSQNYPNPFNPATKISYSIPQSSFVTLKVYDILGREKQTLVNGYQTANRYSIDFNAGKLSSGVYFYQLKTSSGFSEIKKMVLLR
jgi:Abnormal spindle-like microcephaly-assoc'd, ASPM-SPD-2-Hydin/Secretion system C-terminal sorting domain